METVQIAFLFLIAILCASLLSIDPFKPSKPPYVTATTAITLCTVIFGNMKASFGDVAVATSSIILSSATLCLVMNPTLTAPQTLSVQGVQTSSEADLKRTLKRVGEGEVTK